MIFEYNSCDIDWQSVCEHQQEREFEWQLSQCHGWEPDPEEEDVEPWLIAMMEAMAESAEKELDLLLDF